MKAGGLEYGERMELLSEITHPRPLADLLEHAYAAYTKGPLGRRPPAAAQVRRARHVGTRHELHRVRRLLRPRTVRGHRAALPHRRLQTLRQTVPDSARTEELTDLVVWLGELVRQVDSSPLDEWEALRAGTDEHGAPVLPPTPSGVTANERAFRVLVRHAAFRRV